MHIQSSDQLKTRKTINQLFMFVFLAATCFGIVALIALLLDIITTGIHRFTPELLTNFPSRRPANAGLKSALVGSIYMVLIMTPIAFAIGVGAAIYLQEYAKESWFTRMIQLNITTLAGVPSIVYGILGLSIFVEVFALGRSLLAGALTMALLVLPIIIVAAQEAIKAVPRNRRDASFGLGATKWQTVSRAVLPSAMPGILTGVILAVSRALGETAPLVFIGALGYAAFLPASLMDQFTVLPIQIFNWISRPQEAFHELGAAGIMVLLILLFILNITAVIIRNKVQKANG